MLARICFISLLLRLLLVLLLQIIVCSECSRDRGVGIKRGAVCPRHIESLCDCDADCYTYYERLPEPALEALIQSLQALVVQH
jgi:hypothetical protein